jgi:hypothetical protein
MNEPIDLNFYCPENGWTGVVPLDVARKLERERDEAREKLDFLQSKGLTVGLLTTSDKPEPYLAYHIEAESELCDLKHIHKLIDCECKNKELRESKDRISQRAEAIRCELVEAEKKIEAICEANHILNYYRQFAPSLSGLDEDIWLNTTEANQVVSALAKLQPFITP